MEDQTHYVRGFNGGYLLEQFEPELLAKVMKTLDLSNDYLEGLSEGQKEFQQERIRQEIENISRLRDEGKSKGQKKERD